MRDRTYVQRERVARYAKRYYQHSHKGVVNMADAKGDAGAIDQSTNRQINEEYEILPTCVGVCHHLKNRIVAREPRPDEPFAPVF